MNIDKWELLESFLKSPAKEYFSLSRRGWSAKKIADKFRVSPQAVYKSIYRSKRKLRKICL
jgi:predicted DNA-binding protein YlxM (UPF0122 family)